MHFQASQYLQFPRFHICPLPPSTSVKSKTDREDGWGHLWGLQVPTKSPSLRLTVLV